MPYISDEDLLSFQNQIDEAEEENRLERDNHSELIKQEKEKTRKFKISSMILGIIALLGVAGTVYFMNFSNQNNVMPQIDNSAEVIELKEKIANLEKSIQDSQIPNESNSSVTETKGSLLDELTYAVQIGAFEKRNLSLYSQNYVNFKEIKKGEYNKYALGNFATLQEAKNFRKELISIGFKDAFVASYKNGERIRIE